MRVGLVAANYQHIVDKRYHHIADTLFDPRSADERSESERKQKENDADTHGDQVRSHKPDSKTPLSRQAPFWACFDKTDGERRAFG
jgi:hypothetical protein